MMRKNILLLGFAIFSNLAPASETTNIRLGVLASGTLAWELATIENEGLSKEAGLKLEATALANPQAGKVALQAGGVDIIVSDWIWVSDMRAQGGDFSFYPYSASAGGLIVPADSDIKSLADLKGKKLGIAGGELDKNWVLLKALAQKQQIDLDSSLEKVYGAPPLLNQQLTGHHLDALLTYWNFAARLEAQGYRQLMSGEDIIRELGIQESVPSLGYVFKQDWADQHKAALQQFLKIAAEAKDRLCNSDQAWNKIAHLTETDDVAADVAAQRQIRNRYCQGRVTQWREAERNAADKIHRFLQQNGSGKASPLQAGTFWSAD